jgi:hypothetical protein
MDSQTQTRSRTLKWILWAARALMLTFGILFCILGLTQGQSMFFDVGPLWGIQEERDLFASQLAEAEKAFAGSLDSTQSMPSRSLGAQAAVFRSVSALQLRIEVMHRDLILARQEQKQLAMGLSLILQGIGMGMLLIVIERITRGWRRPERKHLDSFE